MGRGNMDANMTWWETIILVFGIAVFFIPVVIYYKMFLSGQTTNER